VAWPVVTVLLSTGLASARPAGADPLASARAQAAQVEAQLHGDQAKLDALAQRYELAQEQLSAIAGQIAQVHDAIAQDQAEVAADQAALRAQALQSYETGIGEGALQATFGPGGEQAAVAQEYSTLATGAITDTVDGLRSAQGRLAQQQSQLQAAQAQAQAALSQIAGARAAAQATAASEQAMLRSLNSEVASLVAGPPAVPTSRLPAPPAGAGGVAVQAAESQIGVPYQWGAEDPGHGFDCSGLTQWSWRQAGVAIPRTANDQYLAVTRVPLADMEPGDLVFWGSGGYAQHVAIYVGDGDVVDAPSSGQDVQVQPIWSSGLMGAGRP
jgi:cell wall-associated NlpC family hydrolase